MGAASSLPYRLRPNKAVDRELFLSLLTRLAAALGLEKYHYVGLGGPFLEDFRLIHSRLGIVRMTCVESEEQVHKRQLFNRPIASIECVHRKLDDYVKGTLDTPVIIWFDYTSPKQVVKQINVFVNTIRLAPLNSILRITLNANPESLGKPDPEEISVESEGDVSSDREKKPTLQEWRLGRFKNRLGSLALSGLTADFMTQKKYGLSILAALNLAIDKAKLSFSDRSVSFAFSTHYADGQPMVTATLVVCPKDDAIVDPIVKGWEFHTPISDPHRIDLPALTTLERLTMESNTDAAEKMGFTLPSSNMGENPLEVFKKFYRIYPHFSRVEV